jgi:hypothetical protein
MVKKFVVFSDNIRFLICFLVHIENDIRICLLGVSIAKKIVIDFFSSGKKVDLEVLQRGEIQRDEQFSSGSFVSGETQKLPGRVTYVFSLAEM